MNTKAKDDGRVETYGTTAIFFNYPTFSAKVGDKKLSAPSVVALKKQIDAARIKKVEAVFEPFEALYFLDGSGYRDEYRDAMITRVKIIGARIEKPHRRNYGRETEKLLYKIEPGAGRPHGYYFERMPDEIEATSNRLYPLTAGVELEAYAEAAKAEELRHKAAEEKLRQQYINIMTYAQRNSEVVS